LQLREILLFFQGTDTSSGFHQSLYSVGKKVFSLGLIGWGLKLTIHLPPVLKEERVELPS
jgi:hypothetical protein